MIEEERYCPLTSENAYSFRTKCSKNNCAWYDIDNKKCAIVNIAEYLYDIREAVCDA